MLMTAPPIPEPENTIPVARPRRRLKYCEGKVDPACVHNISLEKSETKEQSKLTMNRIDIPTPIMKPEQTNMPPKFLVVHPLKIWAKATSTDPVKAQFRTPNLRTKLELSVAKAEMQAEERPPMKESVDADESLS